MTKVYAVFVGWEHDCDTLLGVYDSWDQAQEFRRKYEIHVRDRGTKFWCGTAVCELELNVPLVSIDTE